MKSLKYITLGCLLVLGSTSCKKYLDVNTDPNNPNNQSVLVQNRLPWIEHYYMYTQELPIFVLHAWREFIILIAATQNTFSTSWQCTNGNSTTPYQTWFVASIFQCG